MAELKKKAEKFKLSQAEVNELKRAEKLVANALNIDYKQTGTNKNAMGNDQTTAGAQLKILLSYAQVGVNVADHLARLVLACIARRRGSEACVCVCVGGGMEIQGW